MTKPVCEAIAIPCVLDNRPRRYVYAGRCRVGLESSSRRRLRIQHDVPHMQFLRVQFWVGWGPRLRLRRFPESKKAPQAPQQAAVARASRRGRVDEEAAADIRRVAQVVGAHVDNDHGFVRQPLPARDEAAVRQGAVLLEEHDVKEQAEADGQQRAVEDARDVVLGKPRREAGPHGADGGDGAGVDGAEEGDLGRGLGLADELGAGVEADGAESRAGEAADDVVPHLLVHHERRGWASLALTVVVGGGEEARGEEGGVGVPVLLPDDDVELRVAAGDAEHAHAALLKVRREEGRLGLDGAGGGGLGHDEHQEGALLGLPWLPVDLGDVPVVSGIAGQLEVVLWHPIGKGERKGGRGGGVNGWAGIVQSPYWKV